MNEEAENSNSVDAEEQNERRELNDLLRSIIQPIVREEITKSDSVVQKAVILKVNDQFEQTNAAIDSAIDELKDKISPLLREDRLKKILSDNKSVIEELKNSIQSSIDTSNQALQESIQQNYRKLTYKLYWFWGGASVFMLGCFILFYILFSK